MSKKIKKLIKEFKNKYYIYKGIKRFSIQVIECISSGKSKILKLSFKLKKNITIRCFFKTFFPKTHT